MPTIELSAAFMSGLPARVIRNTELNLTSNVGMLPGFTSAPASGSMHVGLLKIMKGTIASLASLTLGSSRIADLLIRFNTAGNLAGYTPSDFTLTDQSVNPALITTTLKNASASGVASWFWWHVQNTAGTSGLWDPSINYSLVGTIGGIGSGSDLEIPDTSIVSGTAYRIVAMKLQFASTWTY